MNKTELIAAIAEKAELSKKDAEAVNTVAQTQKRVKDAEKSEVLTAPSGNKAATVKTEIKGTSTVLVK